MKLKVSVVSKFAGGRTSEINISGFQLEDPDLKELETTKFKNLIG